MSLPTSPKPTILRLKQLQARIGLSRSTIYDKINTKSPRHDPAFPRQVSLGPDAVGWVESEVDAWLESRIAASRKSVMLVEHPPEEPQLSADNRKVFVRKNRVVVDLSKLSRSSNI